MEQARKVGQEFDVVKGVLTLNACVDKKTPLVKRDLSNRGLNLKARVPCAALRAVEAAAEGARMGVGGIHDMSFWHTEEQFSRSNRRIASILRKFALVGCCIEFAEIREDIEWQGQAFQYTFRAIFCRNQAMGSSLVKLCKSRQSVSATFRIQQASHLLQSGNPCPDDVLDRRLATKK